jgi:hypothetical protein
LDWLARNPDGYSPQPYEQLAAVYRSAGRDQDARTVGIAKQRARRRTLGPAGRLWSLLLDRLVGYGYRTWLAGVWLAVFWLAGWAAFDRAHDHQKLVLAKPGEAHPSFHGAVYSLDTLLPVVDLHQQDVWIPHGWVQWWAWASILAGWVLTTAVVAALTGLLKRDWDGSVTGRQTRAVTASGPPVKGTQAIAERREAPLTGCPGPGRRSRVTGSSLPWT